MTDIARYPIGEFVNSDVIDMETISDWINDISLFPQCATDLTYAPKGEELDYRYREEEWTIRQIVHHCADSHMNSLIRFKLALTKDTPTIKSYEEAKWAELIDSTQPDIQFSLKLLQGLHRRWTFLLLSLTDEQLNRTFVHPEYATTLSLKETIGIYAWHCNHHLAHMRRAIELKI